MKDRSKNKVISGYICKECYYQSQKFYGQCPKCKCSLSFEINHTDQKSMDLLNESLSNKITLCEKKGYLINSKILKSEIKHSSINFIAKEPSLDHIEILPSLTIDLLSQEKELELMYVMSSSYSHHKKNKINHLLKGFTKQLSYLEETCSDMIIDHLRSRPEIKVLVLDSISLLKNSSIDSFYTSQLRLGNPQVQLIEYCSDNEITLLAMAHLNKKGQVYGPRSLEYMVDTIYYMRSDGRIQKRYSLTKH